METQSEQPDWNALGYAAGGWFDSGRVTVRPEWIDYNGHMNVGYYVVAFDSATDALLDHLDVGEAYRHRENAGIYVLEAHVTYDLEVAEGVPIAFRTLILDHDPKRFHLIHHMIAVDPKAENGGYLAATNELLCMHVDLTSKRGTELPESARLKLADIAGSSDGTTRPQGVGRIIGIRRR